MSESEHKPFKQPLGMNKFAKLIKSMIAVFWILRTLAFTGFGVLLQGKYLPYASGSVRNIVHWVIMLASFLLLFLSFFLNLLLVRWTNDFGIIGGMVTGLKVNQLLFLAKNEFKSKKVMRRLLAIHVLPLVTSDEVLETLSELEVKETGRVKGAILSALDQVRENLTNGENLVTERAPYKDHTGEYISTFPIKVKILLGPIFRLASNFSFLGIIMVVRGVLNIVFVEWVAKMLSLETLVLIGVGLVCIFLFPIIFFLMFYLDLRQVSKLFKEQDIQRLVDMAYLGLGQRSNANRASFAFLALAELGEEGTIEPLLPVLETSNNTTHMTVVFSLDILAVKTNYPERFSYRILI